MLAALLRYPAGAGACPEFRCRTGFMSPGRPRRVLFVYRAEGVLRRPADGADPGVWDVLKRRAGRDAALWVAFCRVIYVAAYSALVFLHDVSSSFGTAAAAHAWKSAGPKRDGFGSPSFRKRRSDAALPEGIKIPPAILMPGNGIGYKKNRPARKYLVSRGAA